MTRAFRPAGPVTVLCSARIVGAACTLLWHLHTVELLFWRPTPEDRTKVLLAPDGRGGSPRASMRTGCLPASAIRHLLRIEFNLQ